MLVLFFFCFFILISYLLAGTTWTQELVWQILHDGKVSEAKINLRFPWYEAGPWQPDTNYFTPQSQAQIALDALPSPRRMKCHLPIHLMPLAISTRPFRCKCIYVMRNPKDAAVSHYHQMVSMKGKNYNGTWDQFLPLQRTQQFHLLRPVMKLYLIKHPMSSVGTNTIRMPGLSTLSRSLCGR